MGTSGKLTKSEEILYFGSRCRRGSFGTQATATQDASRWSPPGQQPGGPAASEASPHHGGGCPFLAVGYWTTLVQHRSKLVLWIDKEWGGAAGLVWYLLSERRVLGGGETELPLGDGEPFWFRSFVRKNCSSLHSWRSSYLVYALFGRPACRAFDFVRGTLRNWLMLSQV